LIVANADRIIELLHEAKARPAGEERERFLAEACRDDAALKEQILSLLAAEGDDSGSFLRVTQIVRPTIPPTEKPGDRIGRYKLLQQIGEGGCGVVYMTEQEEPVRRRVALKVIKAGMDTKQVLARFEAERQALALMDHPNIARVLDAGATETGRPFFVMELVKGVPVTRYCDENRFDTDQRLKLFIQICQAVQHAHQKGIIHRDIKPSNILVADNDGMPVPKIIDFGLAKATNDQRLTDKTLFTAFEQFIGTPAYMSPEQANLSGQDIDTRSDIYSLGVLLYELLTGKTPFDNRRLLQAGLDEVRRIIREDEPPRPSTRLSTLDVKEQTDVARHRQAEPPRLMHLVRGDLDWIVMKCLEKERGRRYETANGVARDVERHLGNEPVSARPPSASYRLHRLVRRNRVVFGTATAVTIAVLIGSGISIWEALRASRALSELRAAAPALAEQARSLAQQERFTEAIERLEYAAKLRPDSVEYLLAKANLLEATLNLGEAAKAYRGVLRLKPENAAAESNAKLCEELLAGKPGTDTRLARESLARLQSAMEKEGRPAAELMPVAHLLGNEKNVLLQVWTERLKGLPVSPNRPLKDRLGMREDGLLALDLSKVKIEHLEILEGAPIGGLDLSGTPVEDLTPLNRIRTVKRLSLSDTKVSDLSPLRGLPLQWLDVNSTKVTDLGPLKGMPLEHLEITGDRITSLSALTGMRLKQFSAALVPVSDFTPLAGMPLTQLNLQGTTVQDLGFIRGMPLEHLMIWGCEEARNFSALTNIATLQVLLLPGGFRSLPDEELSAIAALRNLPALKQLAADFMRGSSSQTLQAKELFWQEWDKDRAMATALRALGARLDLTREGDGTYALNLSGAPITNLSMLHKDMPISKLYLAHTKVRDLEPLRGMRLRSLSLSETEVSDLRPLEGMPLQWLNLGGSASEITNLAPLRDMPLKALYASGLRGAPDVSLLAAVSTLEEATLPPLARNLDSLRKHPGLKRLSFRLDSRRNEPAQSVAEFWQMRDDRAKLPPGSAFDLSLEDDGTYALNLSGAPITNLSMLHKDMPISALYLTSTKVRDLEPLRGMRLRSLSLAETEVSDLQPLEGMPLQWLSLGGPASEITNLAPLRGMPLKTFYSAALRGAPDVSVLAAVTNLEAATLPPLARNLDSLRKHPGLKRLSFRFDSRRNEPAQSVEEFWQMWDDRAKLPSGSSFLDARDGPGLLSRTGQVVTVYGRIAKFGTSRSRTYHYLNFAEDYRSALTLAFHVPDNTNEFREDLVRVYTNKTVTVTGMITEHLGTPQILMKSLSELKVVQQTNEPAATK
jgi:serine/threonine protein kinase/Leucine-rich repeat (LRR) protein